MQINKIKSSLFALSLLTSAGAWAQSTFTPVTTLTEGWYQIKETTGTGLTTEETNAISNGTNYLCATNSEIKRTRGSYGVKLDGITGDNEPKSYFYLKPTSNGYYSLQSINGHYLGAEGLAYTSSTTIKGQVKLTPSDNAFCLTTENSVNTSTMYVYAYTDANFSENPYMGATAISTSAGKARYQFSKTEIPESNFKAYTVNITGAPEGSSPCFNATVTCNSEKSKGIATVYNGGRFFVSKDVILTESDLKPLNIFGKEAVVIVDEAQKTVNVTYTDIADGAVVRIINVQKDGSRWPLYIDSSNGLMVDKTGSASLNQSDYFVVKRDEGKFAFISAKTGGYMSYRGKGSTTNGNVSIYSNITCGFNLTPAAETTYPTKAYPDNSGIVYADKRSTTQTDNTVGCFVIIKSTGAFDGYGASVGYADTHSNLFVLEPVTDYNYHNINLQAKNDKNYASVYLPYSFTLPEGVEAYYGRALNDDQSQITLTAIEGKVVPKGTAVVCVSNSVSGAQTLAPALNTTEPTAITDNKLHGTIEATNVAEGQTIYGFTGKYDEIGFYKWTGTQLPLGKAYLSVNTPQAAAVGFALNFDDSEITGIGTATTIQPTKGNAVCYDLYGRRISQPTKGIFIMNGKKVIR